MPSHEARLSRAVAGLKADLSPAQLDRVVEFVKLLALSTSVPFTTVQTPDLLKPNTRHVSVMAMTLSLGVLPYASAVVSAL